MALHSFVFFCKNLATAETLKSSASSARSTASLGNRRKLNFEKLHINTSLIISSSIPGKEVAIFFVFWFFFGEVAVPGRRVANMFQNFYFISLT